MSRFFAFSIAFVICSLVGSQGISQDSPNIVLIFADDLGINDLHCYGRTEHKTPSLDSLAEEGIRYSNAYCGLSICSASRAALMTGKFPARLHLTTFLPGRPDSPSQKLRNARIHNALPPEERTIAEELKKVGYRTGIFGKWHLGSGPSSPQQQGFDTVFEPGAKGQLNESTGAKNEFLIAKTACDFIREAVDKPFFCYVPHHSPHIRLDATSQSLEENRGTFNPLYAANIASLDRSIGMIRDTVHQLKSDRDTIILFASDNGGLHVPEGHEEPMTHCSPFRAGKGYLYEGGIRIPLIVHSARNRFGEKRQIHQPVSLLDLYPTLLGLAGIDVAKTIGPVDGVDLRGNWLEKKPLRDDRTLFWHMPHYTNQGSRPAGAIREGKWKLVVSYEDNSRELFDLGQDLEERNNLALSHAETANGLHEKLESWLNSVGAQRCDANPNVDSSKHAAIYSAFDSSNLRAGQSADAVAQQWKPWRKLMNQATQGSKALLKEPAGDITLWASEATVHGKKLRYESEPQKNVLGYWTEVEDWAHWDFEVPSDGIYEIEVQCGCGKGNGGSIASVVVGTQTKEWKVRDTGHFQSMIYEPIGELVLAQGKNTLEVRPKTKANVAVMDIRKIVLRKKD